MKLKLFLLITLLAISVPIVTGKPYQNTIQNLQDPIFGYINFMPEVTLDSMLGGKYASIKHPYLYLSSGKSVKCYEPTSGKLAHTVPFDSSKESPWSATDEGVTFLSSQKTDRYCRLGRFDGSELTIPIDEKVYYVSWGTKPLLVYQEYDSASRFYTFEAKDLDGKTVWKIENITDFERLYDHFWMEINRTYHYMNMQTGEIIVSLPNSYNPHYSYGSVAFITDIHSGKKVLFNIETDTIIYEGNDYYFLIGQGEILIYRPVDKKDKQNCYHFERIAFDGILIEQFEARLPENFTIQMNYLSGFQNRFVMYPTIENYKGKMIIFDTVSEKRVGEIEGVSKSRIIDDKIFFIGGIRAGCFDLASMQIIWTIPIGNYYNYDIVYEKDFGKFKLFGREIISRYNTSTVSLQVKIIDKIDNSVEPFEFEFENGGLRNCYETDYGFININDLSRFSIYRPQISFYRRGSIKAVGTIDYIGKFDEKTIAIKDGRYLSANLEDGKTVSIDCRLMTFQVKEKSTASSLPSFQ